VGSSNEQYFRIFVIYINKTSENVIFRGQPLNPWAGVWAQPRNRGSFANITELHVASPLFIFYLSYSVTQEKNCLYPLLDRCNSHLLLIQSYTYQFIKYLDMIVGWIFRQLFNYKSKISGFLQIFSPWNQGNPWDAPMSKYHRSEISLCGTLDTTIHEQTHTASETHSQTVCCSSSSRSNFKSHFCAFKVLNAAIACCRCTTTATSTPTSDGSSVS